MKDAKQALADLHAGNLRFLRGESTCRSVSTEQRAAMVASQEPEAAILCCSDSRVAPEIIFDAALGQLFVVRIGGAVLDNAALASLEFAVAELSVPLVLVLGHQNCGTVTLAASGRSAPGSIGTLTSQLYMPVVHARSSGAATEEEIIAAATRSHTLETAAQLPHRSMVIASAVSSGALHIGAAVYGIASGKVELVEAH